MQGGKGYTEDTTKTEDTITWISHDERCNLYQLPSLFVEAHEQPSQFAHIHLFRCFMLNLMYDESGFW